jgi:mono/diheme cytochrome c family protein
VKHPVSSLLAIAAAALVGVGMAQSGGSRTVWDGVYTQAQAARGHVEYDTWCASCHQSDLSGGVLVGDDEAPTLRSMEKLVERRDLDNVFTFIKNGMPREEPGSLKDETYVDILTYLLQENGFPAGTTELKAESAALRAIAIVRRP